MSPHFSANLPSAEGLLTEKDLTGCPLGRNGNLAAIRRRLLHGESFHETERSKTKAIRQAGIRHIIPRVRSWRFDMVLVIRNSIFGIFQDEVSIELTDAFPTIGSTITSHFTWSTRGTQVYSYASLQSPLGCFPELKAHAKLTERCLQR